MYLESLILRYGKSINVGGDFSGSDKNYLLPLQVVEKLGDVVIIVTNSIGSILFIPDRSVITRKFLKTLEVL